jgi:uncharacterized protein YkwD
MRRTADAVLPLAADSGWVGVARRFAASLAVVAVAVAVAGALSASAWAGSSTGSASMRSLESSVLVDINAFRSAHGLPRLHLNPHLTAAARAHSQQMALDGYFAHNSADGSAFWRRIQQFYASARWNYWSVGENLLWSSPSVDASHALSMWLASPEHRANLMNPHWREIGVAAVHADAAPGIYHGMPVTIVTTDFGVRH